MKRAAVFLFFIIVTLTDVYVGLPVHVSSQPSSFWSGDINQQVEQTKLNPLLVRAAEGLRYLHMPAGRVAFGPTITKTQQLGLVDALVNIIAIISFTVALTVILFVGGLFHIYDGITTLAFLHILTGGALVILAPVIMILFGPLVFVICLIFENSSPMYLAPMVLFGAVASIPYLALAVWGLSALLNSIGSSGAGVTGDGGGSAGTNPPATHRVTRIDPSTGIVQTQGLFWWKDGDTRIDPVTHVVQKRGLFWWKDKGT